MKIITVKSKSSRPFYTEYIYIKDIQEYIKSLFEKEIYVFDYTEYIYDEHRFWPVRLIDLKNRKINFEICFHECFGKRKELNWETLLRINNKTLKKIFKLKYTPKNLFITFRTVKKQEVNDKIEGYKIGFNIGDNQIIDFYKFRHLIDYDNGLDVDLVLDQFPKDAHFENGFKTFISYFETQCAIGCCGHSSLEFGDKEIINLVRKVDAKILVQRITSLRNSIQELKTNYLSSDYLEFYIEKKSLINLFDYLLNKINDRIKM